MIFDLKNLQVDILKQFDGKYNYFNPSYCTNKTIFRREINLNNKILVSDIIDDRGNIILEHNFNEKYFTSYEDARFINKDAISVCCCNRNKNDFKIINVEYRKYDLLKKEFSYYKTQNAPFEKHWQFFDHNIIYHIDPYIMMNEKEEVIYKKILNFHPWIQKYGNPKLSTNIFDINGKKYILFHSYIVKNDGNYKYYTGLLYLNDCLIPIGYAIDPLFESSEEYTDKNLLNRLWEWKKTEYENIYKHEVVFPMTVCVENETINIYSGINDCSAVNIKIYKRNFIDIIKNTAFILV
jgi:hypothetical protein